MATYGTGGAYGTSGQTQTPTVTGLAAAPLPVQPVVGDNPFDPSLTGEGALTASATGMTHVAVGTVVRKNWSPNPNFVTTSGTTTMRTNLFTNPRLGTGSTGYGSTGGTGARVAQGAGFAWSIDGSTTTQLLSASFTGTAGQYYAGRVTVNGPTGRTATVQLHDGTSAVSAVSPVTLTGSATEYVLVNTAAAVGTTLRVIVSPTSTGGAWLSTEMLTMTNVLAENPATSSYGTGGSAGPYFDGAAADTTEGWTHAWSGTADASTSLERCSAISPLSGLEVYASTGIYGGKTSGGQLRYVLTHAYPGTPIAFSASASTLPAVPGDRARMRFQMRQVGSSTAYSFTPRLAGYTSGGGFVSFLTNGVNQSVSGAWVDMTAVSDLPAPPTTASIRLILYAVGTIPAGAVFEAQTVVLESGTGIAEAPDAYFDGSTASTTNNAYAWTGTTNASTSTWTISSTVVNFTGGSYLTSTSGLSIAKSLAMSGSGTLGATGSAPAITAGKTLSGSGTLDLGLWTRPNRVPDFPSWTLAGGASIDGSGNVVVPQGGTATSPFIYVGDATLWWFSTEYFNTTQASYVPYQPNATSLLGSSYWAADRVTQVTNSAGYSANGNVLPYPTNAWSSRSTTGYYNFAGGATQYLRMVLTGESSWGAGTFLARLPMVSISSYVGFAPYVAWAPVGTPAIAQGVAVSGSGTLTATGRPGFPVAEALSGSGTLGAVGSAPAALGVETLSGSGTLTLAGRPDIPGVVALTGSGALVALGSPAISATSTLTGSGALTTTGVVAVAGAEASTGSGALTLAGSPVFAVAVALSGGGGLAAAGTMRIAVAVALAGSGVLTTAQLPAPVVDLPLTGQGQLLTVVAALHVAQTVPLAGSGNLVSVGAAVYVTGLVMLTGLGLLTADPTVAVSGFNVLAGDGALTMTGGVFDPQRLFYSGWGVPI